MRCLDLVVVGICHGAIAFMGELFGAVSVVTAAQYVIMSLDVANHKEARS
jgi:hypoxanthine-guanine phosphoribosyltransferase